MQCRIQLWRVAICPLCGYSTINSNMYNAVEVLRTFCRRKVLGMCGGEGRGGGLMLSLQCSPVLHAVSRCLRDDIRVGETAGEQRMKLGW